jgi:hypothetical protein
MQAIMARRQYLWLATAFLLLGDLAGACERPGGSSLNVRRSFPVYPRMPYRPGYPPPVFPSYPGGVMPGYVNYNADPNGGYAAAPAVNYSALHLNAPAKPTRLLAPSLPTRAEPVVQTLGTNRLRYVAISIGGSGNADTAKRLEDELGKLVGVRGVNVKSGKGPITLKVWYSDVEPVLPRNLIAEIERLGLKGTIDGGT